MSTTFGAMRRGASVWLLGATLAAPTFAATGGGSSSDGGR